MSGFGCYDKYEQMSDGGEVFNMWDRDWTIQESRRDEMLREAEKQRQLASIRRAHPSQRYFLRNVRRLTSRTLIAAGELLAERPVEAKPRVRLKSTS